MRRLEERLGIRLLTRTTHSVLPTEAGERLLRTVGPRFDEVEAKLAALNDLRRKPAGTIRITAGDHSATTLLWPKPAGVLAPHPNVKLEINAEGGLIDIAAQQHAAGVCAWVSSSPRTWRRSGSAPTFVSPWSARSPISPHMQSPRRHRIWWRTHASICACRPTAAYGHGTSSATAES